MTTLATLTITNPGFETGDMTGWIKDTLSIEARNTGFDEGPHSGLWLAYGGGSLAISGTSESRFWQDKDVSAYADYIDTGLCTLAGFACWHATRDDQNDTGYIEARFLDVSNNTLSAPVRGDLGTITTGVTGWTFIDLGTKAVPVGTRKIRLSAASIWYLGAGNDNYWDDFVSPTLEYSGPSLGVTNDFTIAFSASGTLTIGAPTTDSGPAPAVVHDLSLAFLGNLRLALAMRKFPLFTCPAPEAKTWARATVAAKAWACVTVVPAEECEGVDDTTFDWIGAVDGSDFASVSDYQIKAA